MAGRPASNGLGLADFVMATSALVSTVLVALSWLLGGLGSGVRDDTTTLLVMAPDGVEGSTLATMVMVEVAPAASVPSGQVTDRCCTPATVQFALAGAAETKVSEAGSTSATTTACASEGPPFVALMVYVTFSPACTVAGLAVLVTARSAKATTSVVSVAVLLELVGSGVGDEAVAVLVNGPGETLAPTVTVTTMVTVAPTARSPSVQETVAEEWLQVPALVVAETKLVPPATGQKGSRHWPRPGRC